MSKVCMVARTKSKRGCSALHTARSLARRKDAPPPVRAHRDCAVNIFMREYRWDYSVLVCWCARCVYVCVYVCACVRAQIYLRETERPRHLVVRRPLPRRPLVQETPHLRLVLAVYKVIVNAVCPEFCVRESDCETKRNMFSAGTVLLVPYIRGWAGLVVAITKKKEALLAFRLKRKKTEGVCFCACSLITTT